MQDRISPIRPTDDASRRLARGLIEAARFGALAVLHPEAGAPYVSRVAVATDAEGTPLTLVSGLALHTRALAADPRAGLLLGEPGPKGDPLAHPRLSLSLMAEPVRPGDPERAALRERWLDRHPKAKLYVDFPDFVFLRLRILGAALNGGFGAAYELSAADLAPLPQS